MRMITAALVVLLGTQQKLPQDLQVSQLEDPRIRNAGIIVIGGQNPVITNTQQPQLPATQLAPAAGETPASQSSTIRVDVGLLDKLMNHVGELVLARNDILQLAGQAAGNC